MLVCIKPAERCGIDNASQRPEIAFRWYQADSAGPGTRRRTQSACVETSFEPAGREAEIPRILKQSADWLRAQRPRLFMACRVRSLSLLLVCACGSSDALRGQAPATPVAGDSKAAALTETSASGRQETGPGLQWAGLPVRHITFEGVPAARLEPLPGQLAQAEGAALNENKLKTSLRQLYATGLFETIEVAGTTEQGGVDLIFRGTPATFIGTVGVDGATGATMNTQLERASQLDPGTHLSQAKMNRALLQMRATLEENGYYQAVITQKVTSHPEHQLADISFRVVSGPRARVGKVALTGDSGMSLVEFRRHAHLRGAANVDHETVSRALDGVLKYYQSQNRLEADVKLESAQYNSTAKAVDYHFTANRGPVVDVVIDGASMEPDRAKHLIPIFEEGSVDEDLLNEGNRRLRDYLQRRGYFDVKVDHSVQSQGNEQVTIRYAVQMGTRRKVERVSIEGNHYFDTATLMDLVSVHAADVLDRHGLFSQALVASDVNALENVYQSNGFSQVKVTPETSSPEAVLADTAPSPVIPAQKSEGAARIAPLTVTYHITEGQQSRVGTLTIEGNDHIPTETLAKLLNTAPGQPLSPRSLAGDHDALVTEYYRRGFDQVAVTVAQQPDPGDAGKADVKFLVDEGKQIFVRDVLTTGLEMTRPQTVAKAITVRSGDPLNQSALAQTQQNLYSFALFNEVRTAVENPAGGETRKDVLLQITEARRWTLTYGVGFEAQTGQPQNNCAGAFAGGVACNPNGKTGVSPRGLAEITRNNLFGREQSASLRGTYGLLEGKPRLAIPDSTF